MKIVNINTYKVTQAIADGLKSKLLAGIETSKVYIYAESNFTKPLKVYANMSADEESFYPLSIVINEIGSSYMSGGKETNMDILAIQIQIKIPQEPIVQTETNGFIEYENYFKLSEFSEVILQQVLDKTKTTICYNLKQAMFRPDDVTLAANEYSGLIELTYELPLI